MTDAPSPTARAEAVTANAHESPVFGFIFSGGPISGALVRDLRLANELARRGYEVHVWWAMDRTRETHIEPNITEHWLFHGLRYFPLLGLGWWARGAKDWLGRAITQCTGDIRRNHHMQKRPGLIEQSVQSMLRAVGDGIERDGPLVRRFAKELDQAGVTHVLPMLAILCPFIDAARQHTKQPIEYLVTIQGDELYMHYARQIGYEDKLHAVFQNMVTRSGRRAIAVSEDYKHRVSEDLGIPLDSLVAIPPGVDQPENVDRAYSRQRLQGMLNKRGFDTTKPIVTYIGRQDNEKGIDLLLYAATILRRRGVEVQVIVAGSTLFDGRYAEVCKQIAANLRLPVSFHRKPGETFRMNLFAGSDCIVYPSIHREPFGMVPTEAASVGTPAIVPDWGGIAHAIEANGQMAGLRFDAWDSGALADALQKLIEDDALWQQLHEAGPAVADYYSVPNLADRVLAHLDLSAEPVAQK